MRLGKIAFTEVNFYRIDLIRLQERTKKPFSEIEPDSRPLLNPALRTRAQCRYYKYMAAFSSLVRNKYIGGRNSQEFIVPSFGININGNNAIWGENCKKTLIL